MAHRQPASSYIGTGNEPAEIERQQSPGRGLRLTATLIGQMRVANARIPAGGRENPVEFGLPMADQDYSEFFRSAGATPKRSSPPCAKRACRGAPRPPCSQGRAEAQSPVFQRRQGAEGKWASFS